MAPRGLQEERDRSHRKRRFDETHSAPLGAFLGPSWSSLVALLESQSGKRTRRRKRKKRMREEEEETQEEEE